jgi:hypothetical protein
LQFFGWLVGWLVGWLEQLPIIVAIEKICTAALNEKVTT